MALVWKGTRADLVLTLRRLSAALAGTGSSAGVSRAVRAILIRGAVALLSRVQQAFVVKARGGVGDDGIRWPRLSRKTIAARRTTRAERKALGVGGRRTRGLLTPAQDKRWRGIFASTLAHMNARGVAGGAARAAAIAWATLKREGAKTKLDVLGGRTVEILRDTGMLLRSLTPGFEDAPTKQPGQVVEVTPGKVAVGSNVPYAATHHRGRPGRIPARRLWPTDGIPSAWSRAMGDAMIRGIVLAVSMLATQPGSRT